MNMQQMEEALRGEGYEYVARRFLGGGLSVGSGVLASVFEKEGVGRVVMLSDGNYEGEAQIFAPARIEDFLTPRVPGAPTLTVTAEGEQRYMYELFVYRGEGGAFYSHESSEFPIEWKLKPRGAVFERQYPEPRAVPDEAKLLRECEAPTQLLDQLREIYGREPGTPLPY